MNDNNMSMIRQKRELLFAWPVSHLHLLLPAMIAVAAILHFLALLGFRLVYPEPLGAAMRSHTVFMNTAEMPLYATAGAWAEASDPALFSSTVADYQLMPIIGISEYQPGFDRSKITLRQPRTLGIQMPSLRATAQPVPMVSKVSVRPSLNAPSHLATLSINAVGDFTQVIPLENISSQRVLEIEKLAPIGFLAGVDAMGHIKYLFLEQASGTPDSISAFAQVLRSQKYPPSSEELRWVRLTLSEAMPSSIPTEPEVLNP